MVLWFSLSSLSFVFPGHISSLLEVKAQSLELHYLIFKEKLYGGLLLTAAKERFLWHDFRKPVHLWLLYRNVQSRFYSVFGSKTMIPLVCCYLMTRVLFVLCCVLDISWMFDTVI